VSERRGVDQNVAFQRLVNAAAIWRTGKLISCEGLWGAGKTTLAARLAARLTGYGFDVQLPHYGPWPAVIEALSGFLDQQPLRSRTGTGGFAAPHHATVDLMLRMCREAHHHPAGSGRPPNWNRPSARMGPGTSATSTRG
jgi:hypothetical protein